MIAKAIDALDDAADANEDGPLTVCQVRSILRDVSESWGECGDTEDHVLEMIPRSHLQLLWLLGACRDPETGVPHLGPDGHLMCFPFARTPLNRDEITGRRRGVLQRHDEPEELKVYHRGYWTARKARKAVERSQMEHARAPRRDYVEEDQRKQALERAALLAGTTSALEEVKRRVHALELEARRKQDLARKLVKPETKALIQDYLGGHLHNMLADVTTHRDAVNAGELMGEVAATQVLFNMEGRSSPREDSVERGFRGMVRRGLSDRVPPENSGRPNFASLIQSVGLPGKQVFNMSADDTPQSMAQAPQANAF